MCRNIHILLVAFLFVFFVVPGVLKQFQIWLTWTGEINTRWLKGKYEPIADTSCIRYSTASVHIVFWWHTLPLLGEWPAAVFIFWISDFWLTDAPAHCYNWLLQSFHSIQFSTPTIFWLRVNLPDWCVAATAWTSVRGVRSAGLHVGLVLDEDGLEVSYLQQQEHAQLDHTAPTGSPRDGGSKAGRTTQVQGDCCFKCLTDAHFPLRAVTAS